MISIQSVVVTIVLFTLRGTLCLVLNSTTNITTQILDLNRSSKDKSDLEEDKGSKLKIAFGSCYGMLHFMTDIFKTINAYDPNLWIWLGDAAYTDDVAAAACKPLQT